RGERGKHTSGDETVQEGEEGVVQPTR
ncbi:MAG: hypothetical protein FD130_2261, partial [Halothiobacillaceae bacterium]